MNRKQIISAMCRIYLALVFLYAAAMKFSSLKLSPVSSRVGLGAFEDLMFRHAM